MQKKSPPCRWGESPDLMLVRWEPVVCLPEIPGSGHAVHKRTPAPAFVVLGRRTLPLSCKAGKKSFFASFKDPLCASDCFEPTPGAPAFQLFRADIFAEYF